MLRLYLRRSVVLLLFLLMFWPLIAVGQVIVIRRAGGGGGGCSCNTERYSLTTGTTDTTTGYYDNRKYGLEFTTTQSDDLCGVTFYAAVIGSNGNSTFEARLDDDTDMTSEYTQTESTVVTGTGEFTFTFSPEVSIADATTYYVFLNNSSSDYNDRVEFQQYVVGSGTGQTWQATSAGSLWSALSNIGTRTPHYKVMVCD